MGLAPYAEINKKYDNIDYNAVELAHKAQTETFDETCELVEKTNSKNIILSGGYFLNCLNNFKLVKKYSDINFFVDPIPHDAGTALGVAVHTANYI
jgi:carbamoyltransferase